MLFLRIVLALSLATLLACRSSSDNELRPDAAPSPDSSAEYLYPAPNGQLVPSVGSEQTLEVATWNIENFPKNSTTPSLVADLIASLDLDMVTLQEVQDIAAFDELVERLRGYEGMLSTHTYGDGSYQKIGYIYRTELISLSGAFLLFAQDGYEFPRPGFKVDVSIHNGDRSFTFTSIALHLKAGGSFNDRVRRQEAAVILERYLRSTVDGTGIDSLMVLGDFNDTLSGAGASVFAPLTNDPSRYTIRTSANASSGDISFVPSDVLLDHIVTTSSLDLEFSGGETIIPRLDSQVSSYVGKVSDHLPVILKTPL